MDNVELKDFIKGALIEITSGIREANESINPGHRERNLFILKRDDKHGAKGIVFDIAVTAKKSQNDSAGIFVALATIGGGAKTEKGTGAEVAHRIRFEVDFQYDFESDS